MSPASVISMPEIGTYKPNFGDLIRQDVPATGAPLQVELKTKDKHVRRDERLIRLTGSHPFNCEAPLSLLYDQGFITPHQLHYVRNHGAVPEVSDREAEDWTISVEGMVENPMEIRLKEIMELEAITLPVTFVCAGNRRGEQNQVRKGKGFNWGAGGVSTSLWTGTLLKNVIDLAGVSSKARYVHFEGADALPNGHYGTSVRLEIVMDYHRAVMVAWKQNGLALSPDHGRPLRVVVPGMIGGRSIKWLKRIVLSDKPSDNWYHYYDNRVLPTMVTDEQARNEDNWWKDERYCIYNLNVQSATVYPEHNGRLNKSQEGTYTVKGYAYSGGGARIGRVEISLDRGRSWKLATIRYPEDEYEKYGIDELFGGKVDLSRRYLCFCWCFWSYEVPMSELTCAKDIVVRAMDENMAVQPRDMYWSLLSMVSNCWFRVAIVDEGDTVRFEHPTHLHHSDGWMDRVRLKGGNLLGPNWGEDSTLGPEEVQLPPVEDVKITLDEKMGIVITQAELAAHANEEDPWFVIKGNVYDGSQYLSQHPGGADSITMVAGEDATDDFLAIHSETAKRTLQQFHLGRLEEPQPNRNGSAVEEPASGTFLNPKRWKSAKLLKRSELSHDVRSYDFALEYPEQTSGLPVGHHIFCRLKDNVGQAVVRAYTPLSDHRTQGILRLLVKIYFPTDKLPGGRMGALLEVLNVGDEIEIKGPLGSFTYLGQGKANYKGKPIDASHVYMVAGGSGITPCYQVLKELSRDGDQTKACLMFGNRTVDDIMCREELKEFAKTGRVDIRYWLAKPPQNWDGEKGYITLDHLDAIVQKENSLLLVCGPPGMVNSVKSWVEKTGYDHNRFVVF